MGSPEVRAHPMRSGLRRVMALQRPTVPRWERRMGSGSERETPQEREAETGMGPGEKTGRRVEWVLAYR